MREEPKNKIYHLYLNSFLAWATNGRFILGENISSIGIKPLADRILTRNKVSKIWQIYQFPYEFPYELIEKLLFEMRLRYPEVTLSFQLINSPIQLNIENNIFVNNRKRAADDYERFQSAFQSLKETDKTTGVKITVPSGMKLSFSKKDVELKKQEWDSYAEATNAVEEGKSIFYSNIFIHAQAPNNKLMNKFSDSFRTKMLSMKLGFRPIKSLLNNYLENYGPAGFISAHASLYQQTFLLRENITHVLPTKTEGFINTEGILMGINVNNGFPFLLEFFKSGQGQTVMIASKTGWGKTHLAFGFVLGLLGANVHVSVTDLKGNEWNKLKGYTDYLEISLGGTHTRSVNTLRLDDMRLSKEDGVYAYNSAVQATVRVLSLLSEVSDNECKGDLEKALEQSVRTLYNQNKVVKENPDTYKNTKNLTYEDVLPFLAEIESSGSLPIKVREVCSLARFRCESILKGSNPLAESLKNEITVQDVIDIPLVIYSLNKNTDQDLTINETILIFMAEYLSTKKHLYRKNLGLHSAILAEEVQRYQEAGSIVDFLSSQTTGARSQNVMVIFLLNSLSKLNAASFAPIKSNVSTVILGLLTKLDIDLVQNEFGYSDIIPDLMEIYQNPQEYKNVFAVSFNTGFQYGKALIRTMLTSEMNKSLATRTIRQ